jgi:hypothetical protein
LVSPLLLSVVEIWNNGECPPQCFYMPSLCEHTWYTLKSAVFLDMTPCSPLKVNRRFEKNITSTFSVE